LPNLLFGLSRELTVSVTFSTVFLPFVVTTDGEGHVLGHFSARDRHDDTYCSSTPPIPFMVASATRWVCMRLRANFRPQKQPSRMTIVMTPLISGLTSAIMAMVS